MLSWIINLIFPVPKPHADPVSPPQDESSFEKRGYGAIPNDPDYRDISLSSIQNASGAPASFMGIQGTLLALPHFDQKALPWCVPHAIAKVLKAYIYRKTGKIVQISPRYAAKICKMFDGYPSIPGTLPRIGALVFTKFGCATEDMLLNDTTLDDATYRGFSLTDAINSSASENKLPGFAVVSNDLEAVKDAIYQNGCVTGACTVGNWNQLPLSLVAPQGSHYAVWYGYETQANGDCKIYIDNSWGNGWLSWIFSWAFPGDGYFMWSDYKNDVHDIYAFTDIPANYLTKAKSMPYKFLSPLTLGSSGLAVQQLQIMLNSDPDTAIGISGPGTPEEETMYFGQMTDAAVMKWQAKHGLPATGYFGPLSIAMANQRIPKLPLMDAIIQTESGGNDYARGDLALAQPAYGCMQIRQGVVDQVNSKLGTSHKSIECLGNRALSILIWNTYWTIFTQFVTDEDKAKAWNGGPGWKSLYGHPGHESYTHNLNLYWATVEKFINNN